MHIEPPTNKDYYEHIYIITVYNMRAPFPPWILYHKEVKKSILFLKIFLFFLVSKS